MQIFMNGYAEKDFAPDQIRASVTFRYHADTYDEALKGGVGVVKAYANIITDATDFTFDDIKTRAYSVVERTHVNRIEPKSKSDLEKNLQKTVSDGFFFSQYAYLEFDYDKERLAKLLAITSKIPNAPALHIDFALKDERGKKRKLIAAAYEDAKKKAEALAAAADKNLRDCVRVEIDQTGIRGVDRSGIMYDKAARIGSNVDSIEQEIKNIDETFKPDDITLSKTISCVWETSN